MSNWLFMDILLTHLLTQFKTHISMKKRKFLKNGSRSIILLFVLAFMAMGAQQAVAQQYYEGAKALYMLKDIAQNVEAEAKITSGLLTKGVSSTAPTKKMKLKYLRALLIQVETNIQGGLKGILDAHHASFIQANPRLAVASQTYYQELDELLKY